MIPSDLKYPDFEIFNKAKELATWPVRMILPLPGNPAVAVDTGGGVDRLLAGDNNIQLIKRPKQLLGPKAYWHLDCLKRFFGNSLEGKRILDIGCGTGYVSALAASQGANVIATEMHDKNIERAKLVFKAFEVDKLAKVLKIDMQKMSPQELGSFDAALFLGTIYHCEYPLDVLKAVGEMTKAIVLDARLAMPEQVNDEKWGLEFLREVYSDQNNFSPIRRVGGGVIRKPTRQSMIKMLRMSGFNEVYQVMPYEKMQKHFLDEEFIQFVAFK